VIEVSDDGAGLNRERILAKAAKQGMRSENVSDDEVWQLIFAPGFSTAETVTDVSGRGVGMDVVKRNIQSMGGHVEIVAGRPRHHHADRAAAHAGDPRRHVGEVGSEIFILPLNFVMESLQPSMDDIYTVGNGERVVRVRGEYLPLVALHEVFRSTTRAPIRPRAS
jgi:two-component system chemotaxis sensor kinase CheA